MLIICRCCDKIYRKINWCPSPSRKRDSSTSDANLEKSLIRGNLSTQMESAVQDKPILTIDTNQILVPKQITGPSTDNNNISPRQRWTKEENVALFKCYCKAIDKKMSKVKGTYEIWRNKNLNTRLYLIPLTLSNQRRLVERTLTNREKENIRKTVSEETEETVTETEEEIPTTEEEVPTEPEEIDDPNDINLNEEQSNMLDELIVSYEHAKMISFEERIIPNRFNMHKDNKIRMENMNKIITFGLNKSYIKVTNILDMNTLHYVAATTLAGAKENKKSTTKAKFNPNGIIDEEISKVRTWIGRITATAQNNKLTLKVKKYLKGENADKILHRLKMKLDALCKRRKTQIANKTRFQNNKLFKHNQKAFYAKLRNGDEGEKITEPPTKEDIQKYWGGLFGDKLMHNKKAEWLNDEMKDMEKIEEAVWVDISPEKLTLAAKKLSNWKAPGLDLVQNFWIKYLYALHPLLAEHFNQEMYEDENKSEWMTGGKTTLIHKKGSTKQANNYRPITCLPTYYKLLTLILTDNIYEHVTENNILPIEQKGVRRKARGCKDHLLLDKIIMEDAKKKGRNLSVMWIDYKKAYDSIPHSWLIAMMRIYKIDERTIRFIIKTMPKWRTKIHLPHNEGCLVTGDITFLRGIFQGDTLSPLLFCLALAPIKSILRRANIGYKIGGTKVSNLLYIDDLKCYAKDDKEMERCRALLEAFSADIGMTFGLKKKCCGTY